MIFWDIPIFSPYPFPSKICRGEAAVATLYLLAQTEGRATHRAAREHADSAVGSTTSHWRSDSPSPTECGVQVRRLIGEAAVGLRFGGILFAGASMSTASSRVLRGYVGMTGISHGTLCLVLMYVFVCNVHTSTRGRPGQSKVLFNLIRRSTPREKRNRGLKLVANDGEKGRRACLPREEPG